MAPEQQDLIRRLDRISEKLTRLREKDREFAIFASRAHSYRLGAPLAEEAAAGYESYMQVKVPIEYRMFLTRVGNGGAGPYYGLFPIDGDDPEDITDRSAAQRPFRWTEAARRVRGDVPGAIYICHYGCAILFFLVINGPCTGEVWRDSRADSQGISPELGPEGRRVRFCDWYERWLDDGLRTVGGAT